MSSHLYGHAQIEHACFKPQIPTGFIPTKASGGCHFNAGMGTVLRLGGCTRLPDRRDEGVGGLVQHGRKKDGKTHSSLLLNVIFCGCLTPGATRARHRLSPYLP